jgi:hypothetical protein
MAAAAVQKIYNLPVCRGQTGAKGTVDQEYKSPVHLLCIVNGNGQDQG